MIETDCQSLIVTAVEAHGGKALKFSNRFFTGVADLLIQLPGHSACILEAKLITLSKKTIETGHTWDVGCTVPQQRFLREWGEAGMKTGVVSFIQEHGVGLKTLRMAVYRYDVLSTGGHSQPTTGGPLLPWVIQSYQHDLLGGKSERNDNIIAQLEYFVGD